MVVAPRDWYSVDEKMYAYNGEDDLLSFISSIKITKGSILGMKKCINTTRTTYSKVVA